MMNVKIQDADFNAKMAQLIVLQQKGVEETVKDVAKRFVKQVVRNTPPMIASQSPAATKRAWEQKITADYEKTRYHAGKWHSKAEIRKVINAKKKKLGRMASGWMKAVAQLKATVPAWVKRHGDNEGYCRVMTTDKSCVIIIGNYVPYGKGLLKPRAEYSLRTVKRGIEGNLRAMKKRLLRSVRTR